MLNVLPAANDSAELNVLSAACFYYAARHGLEMICILGDRTRVQDSSPVRGTVSNY